MRTKISPARRRTYSIMANSGFGACSLIVPMGQYRVVLEVPQKCIRKDGQLKKQIIKHLAELTRENVIALEKKGVKCYVHVHPDQRAQRS